MELNLDDHVFIVTGSSRGIGKGVARILLGEGAKIVLTGRDENALKGTQEDLASVFPDRVISCLGDLNFTDMPEKLETIIMQRWKRVDGLVANAGSVKSTMPSDFDNNDYQWFLDHNFFVALRVINRFLHHLETTSGSIVLIGSIAGVESIGAPLAYSVSKAALTMYAKGLADRLAPKGIRVNTIAPGNIWFPKGNWDRKQKESPEQIHALLEEKIPLKCFGTPEDIGCMTAFLLSDRAKFITGACVVVDGGQTRSW
ncbi:SDR family oxidoreductase [Nitrospiraceae bacterium AH_259_D15_M11_P09]|nr:SDR family oxidoreductase [Nitrospiraceae bacterium AH_259_D15_M11_P09]